MDELSNTTHYIRSEQGSLSDRGLFDFVQIPDTYRSEFDAIQLEEGRSRLLLAAAIGIAMFLGFTPLIWWMLPDISLLDTAVRFGVALPLGILVSFLIKRARTHQTQQIAAGSLALFYSVWTCWIVSSSNAPFASNFITANIIIILFVIIMMRLTLPFALLLSTGIASFQLAVSLVVGQIALEVAVIAFVINVSVTLPSLYALFELKNERRRSFLLAVRDRENLEEMDARNRDLDRLSETDALTGLLNRRGLGRHAFDSAEDPTAPIIACLMIDVDNFKAYNDNYGHPAGDEVLLRVADAIKACCREADVACRYGGEEFVLIRAFEATPDKATLKAWGEDVRRRIEELALPHKHNRPRNVVTVSAGVATLGGGVPLMSIIAATDQSLYEAKSLGRNCVVCFSNFRKNNPVDLLRAG